MRPISAPPSSAPSQHELQAMLRRQIEQNIASFQGFRQVAKNPMVSEYEALLTKGDVRNRTTGPRIPLDLYG